MNNEQTKARITQRSKDLLGALQSHFGEGYTPGTILECSMPADYALACAAASALFEKEVVVFRNLRPDSHIVHGAVIPGFPNRLYINERSPLPPIAVLGHEMVHAMRRQCHDLFGDFMAAVGANIPDASRAAYGFKYRLEGDGGELANLAVYEEMVADAVGDQFATPSFWRGMQARCTGTAKQVCARVEGLVQHLPEHPLGADELFIHHDHVAAVSVAVMGRYSEWVRAGAAPSEMMCLGNEGICAGGIPPCIVPGAETKLSSRGLRL